MKRSSKNWIWLFITISSLIIFLCATLIIGFTFVDRFPPRTDLDILIQNNQHNDSYTTPSIALLLTGIVISALSIILILVKSIINIIQLDPKFESPFWDYIFFGTITLASIFLIIGSAYFIINEINNYHGLIKNDPANNSLLFILLVLPIILSLLVLSLDWFKKVKTNKKTLKNKK